jgi:hypothetical protein
MTEPPSAPLSPPFAEAVARLVARLREEGWPLALRWIRGADLLRLADADDGLAVVLRADDDGDAEAAGAYAAAVRRGLGVALEAVCTLGELTCVVVASPRDRDQARRLGFADGGLQIVVAQPRCEASARWPSC